MRVAVAGGGPGGLYFSILLRKVRPDAEITVYERNQPTDAFGFGVVFSDETLGGFEHADPETYRAMTGRFRSWTDITIHHRGGVMVSGGHGFAAIGRRELLAILQERAADLGVDVRYSTEAPDRSGLDWADLVVAADGASSALRTELADRFQPTLDRRHCRYIWLATDQVLDSFTFLIKETPHGVFQAHCYPYSATRSTLIVEVNEDVWRDAGLDPGVVYGPGESDEAGVRFCRELFAEDLHGHELYSNNSKWLVFNTVRNAHRGAGNVVLVGDAAATAHFSIGSGTKLAMEDSIALAWALRSPDTPIQDAVAAYEAERAPLAASLQRAAQASLEWFEHVGRWVDQSRPQFAFNLLTRSRRITYENLRLRDPGFVAEVDRDFARRIHEPERPPMFMPYTLRGLTLRNRVVVSPMDMYSSLDGTPGDFHLVHLGARSLGGAALVMSEMICVSEIGRITPGCAGMYRPEHVEAWRRIVDFVHAHSGGCAIGAQLGHSGRKGSTKLMWEGIDEPLDEGNWQLIAPSAIAYSPRNQVPVSMTRDDMDRVREQFLAATRGAIDAGFDLLELHMAHGYLLSSFLSPLTNLREDEYGGSLENRSRYPLEVLDACRAAWPAEKPMSVRISATDWVPGGFDADDAVAFSRMLQAHGVDIVDVSSGQVSPEEQPAFGRSYQTPFADRIRNEVGIPTIAVGAISSYDDVNTIILAGRADLCALARPHLYDPHWTLHAAAEQEFTELEWVAPYRVGSRRPPTGRDRITQEMARTFEPIDG